MLRRSLRACAAEGMLAEIVAACAGASVMTGWAIHLGASPVVTGLLVAVPHVAQLFHLPAGWTTARFGHRRACLMLVGASRQVTLPLVALPFLPISDATRLTLLISLVALAGVLAVLGNNAWATWMAELVPSRIRGRYFGRRTALCTAGSAAACAAAGALLDWATRHGVAGEALAGLQLTASAVGAATVALMARQHDPRPQIEPAPLRPRLFLKPLRDHRLRPVLLYQLAWNGAVGLAGSFLALHMLTNLKMGFTLVALHGAATAAVKMLTASRWGHLIDRWGPRRVLVITSFALAAILPIWLLPTETRLWPLAVDALLAGTFWCGQSLASFALPLAVTPRSGRPYYLGAYTAASGLGFTAGAALGGTLAAAFHDLRLLFVLSALLRFGSAFLARRVPEPRSDAVTERLAA